MKFAEKFFGSSGSRLKFEVMLVMNRKIKVVFDANPCNIAREIAASAG
jgi:hypothetical protein